MKIKDISIVKVIKQCIRTSIFLGSMLAFIFLGTATTVNAKEDNEYKAVCDEAMKLIEPLNTDNLDICIRNIYKVIDTEGKMTGYSLGYFVDNTPMDMQYTV